VGRAGLEGEPPVGHGVARPSGLAPLRLPQERATGRTGRMGASPGVCAMATKREAKRYDYRGNIERGAPRRGSPGYRWAEGYSETTPDGCVLYPWATRAECRSAAKAEGKRAVFYRDGKPEAGA
jgi:hypothetical protein